MPPSTGSSLLGCAATSLLSTMSDVAPQKERRRRRSCAASSATSRGRSSPIFASRGSRRQKLLYRHRSVNVYVFNRGDHPMMVFDRDGNFLRSWGEGQYPRAHGVHIAPDDTMFLTDDGGHFVRKVTLDGKVLLELGVPGKPAPYMSGEPFHRCTHTALSPKDEIYVSDGYGNSRVHKYSPDGKLLMSWGAPGTGEGEFNIVHNICCDADGWIYVADRENHRVQVFDRNGRFETQWQNLHRPCGLCMPYGHQPIFYVGEVGPAAAVSRDIPNLCPRVTIVGHHGYLIVSFG